MTWGTDFGATDDDEFSPAAVDRMRLGASEKSDVEAAEALLERIASHLVSVATGGPRIQAVDAEYKREHRALGSILRRLRIEYPNRFSDLWQWYTKWSDGSLPTYRDRRSFVSTLLDPVRVDLEKFVTGTSGIAEGVSDEVPPDWPGVEQQCERLKELWRQARDADAYNGVGLQCIKVLTTVGRLIFDPEVDLPPGEEAPGRDDAKKRIDLFVGRVAPGPRHADLRKVITGAYNQANAAKHRHEASRLDAGIALNSTLLLVEILKLLRADDKTVPF